MKIYYCLSIFLFSCFLLRGQSPTFAPIGSKWGYGYSALSGYGDYMKEAVGDTVIKGRICRKFKTANRELSCGPMPCASPVLNVSSAYIAQSQDSIFQYQQRDSSFVFLFHFHAQVGDTLTTKGYSTTLKFVCSRVVDTVFGGATLKKWEFRQSCARYDRIVILLEKVGVLNRPFDLPNMCVSDDTYYGLCSFKSGNINFQGTSCITSTAENALSEGVTISPNPASTFLKIDTNHPFLTLKIVDLIGKIRQIRPYTEGSLWDISDLSTGVYFLQLTDDKGQKAIKRFVIYTSF